MDSEAVQALYDLLAIVADSKAAKTRLDALQKSASDAQEAAAAAKELSDKAAADRSEAEKLHEEATIAINRVSGELKEERARLGEYSEGLNRATAALKDARHDFDNEVRNWRVASNEQTHELDAREARVKAAEQWVAQAKQEIAADKAAVAERMRKLKELAA